ncbi:PAS domain S-box protein [Salinirussus salinus]|jgi:PAS domain S-box-containing protein|uniref:PAS domain S-box protein n=1 Tax=Salinirussus salinus TaxID=1198300 RepID=UPI00135C7A59|nr:PAS domain S-box protein [Salinirussus salinus]
MNSADHSVAVRAETKPAVLLCMSPGRDRELLADWLAAQAGYGLSVADPASEADIPTDYDLCLLDAAAMEHAREELSAAVEAADPVFLPHLLVAPDDAVEEALGSATPVDEVVTMPVDQQVLHRRIENLIDARRASLRLAEREEQYQQLVELTPETVLVLRDGDVVYANAAAAETFRAAEPEALHGPVTDLVAPDQHDTLFDLLAEVGRDGKLDSFRDLRLVSATGATVFAEVAGVTVTFEGEPAVQLVMRDVTERREREQQLSLFGKAIETARQGVTIADARQDDEPLIYVNEAFEEITGYSTGEVLGRNCRFLQGAETDEETVAEVRRAIDDRRPVVTELLNYRKDGTPFWNRLEVVPVRDEDGEVTHFLGLQRDVTGRREREERLEVLDRVLRHNIRNRMNVIRSRAELLHEEYGDDSIETIIEAADDLIGISDQVRKFQSLVSAEDHDLEPHDLRTVLEEAIARVRDEHPAARIRLDCPDEAVAEVHRTLPAAFGQVLEFAVDGTTLPTDPGSGSDSTPEIDIRVTVGEESVTVELLDYAGTIPHADLDAIGRGSETPLQHSRGMELWLVRWAVLTSDGSLSVEESPPVETDTGVDDEAAAGTGNDTATPDCGEPVGCLRMRFRRARQE